MLEKARARPVRSSVIVLRNGKSGPLEPRLSDCQQAGQSIRGRPASAAGVEQDFFVRRQRGELIEDFFEGAIVERVRHIDNGRHLALNSPLK